MGATGLIRVWRALADDSDPVISEYRVQARRFDGRHVATHAVLACPVGLAVAIGAHLVVLRHRHIATRDIVRVVA